MITQKDISPAIKRRVLEGAWALIHGLGLDGRFVRRHNLAGATILVALSIALLATLELLRRRSERLRGMSPS